MAYQRMGPRKRRTVTSCAALGAQCHLTYWENQEKPCCDGLQCVPEEQWEIGTTGARCRQPQSLGFRGGGTVRRRYASGGTMSGYYATGYDCQCHSWDWLGLNCDHESCTCTCSNGQTYHHAGGCNNHYNDYSCSSVCDSFCAGLSLITPQGFGGRNKQGRLPVRRRPARGGRFGNGGDVSRNAGRGPCSGLDGSGNNC
tara:strand:+ start:628 stop:1224 length:597 start_codon:yes stop_codon:yes gene_type:complete